MESIFQEAKLAVEEMISRFEVIALNLDDLDKDILEHKEFDEKKMRLIPISRKALILQRFSREADASFLEAKRATVFSKAEIPSWFLGLTLLLGWNEFLAILRNPLLTLTLAMIVGGLYLIYYTQMGRPALQVVKATANEIFHQTKEELRKRGLDSDHIYQSLKGFLIFLMGPPKVATFRD